MFATFFFQEPFYFLWPFVTDTMTEKKYFVCPMPFFWAHILICYFVDALIDVTPKPITLQLAVAN